MKSKRLSNIQSVKELTELRKNAKFELEIEKLEFKNSHLLLMRELDGKRIWADLSSQVFHLFQTNLLSNFFNRSKKK